MKNFDTTQEHNNNQSSTSDNVSKLKFTLIFVKFFLKCTWSDELADHPEDGPGHDGRPPNSSGCGSREMRIIIVMRLVGMTLALAAAVVAGTNNESQIIPFTLVTGLPPLHIPYTAKWHYLSSIVYFVAINAIACTYSAASFVFLVVASGKRSSAETALLLLLMGDLITVPLLFSAIGAAAAVGLIGVNGNSHTQWHKVCYVFKKYCHYGEAAVIISMLGAVVFLSPVVLATLKLHKKSSW